MSDYSACYDYELSSCGASAGWAPQQRRAPHCCFCISKQHGNTEFCVCLKHTILFFFWIFDLHFALSFGAIILPNCTNDLICLTNLFCRDLLYKPVVICKSSFFLYTENSLCHTLQNSFIIYWCSMWSHIMFLVCPQSYAYLPGIPLCCV